QLAQFELKTGHPRELILAEFKAGRKACGHCKLFKPFADYSKHIASKTGMRSMCKACRCDPFRPRIRLNAPRVRHEQTVDDHLSMCARLILGGKEKEAERQLNLWRSGR